MKFQVGDLVRFNKDWMDRGRLGITKITNCEKNHLHRILWSKVFTTGNPNKTQTCRLICVECNTERSDTVHESWLDLVEDPSIIGQKIRFWREILNGTS